MLLAQPRALFPAVAALAFGGGARTVGLSLRGGGGGFGSRDAVLRPARRGGRQGLAVMVSVALWGVGIIGFGLAWREPARWWSAPTRRCGAALSAMAFAGAADAVSAVFRTTILQSAAPDRMRGRLQGVFIVVVAGGPGLGDLVAGTGAPADRRGRRPRRRRHPVHRRHGRPRACSRASSATTRATPPPDRRPGRGAAPGLIGPGEVGAARRSGARLPRPGRLRR